MGHTIKLTESKILGMSYEDTFVPFFDYERQQHDCNAKRYPLGYTVPWKSDSQTKRNRWYYEDHGAVHFTSPRAWVKNYWRYDCKRREWTSVQEQNNERDAGQYHKDWRDVHGIAFTNVCNTSRTSCVKVLWFTMIESKSPIADMTNYASTLLTINKFLQFFF